MPTLPPCVSLHHLCCACGKYFADYAQFQSGRWNTTPHLCCKACHLKNKPPRRRFPKHNSLETDPPLFNAPLIASAKASFSAHPRLDVCISMPSPCGGFNVDVPGAVVNSSAQVCLLPKHALRRAATRPQHRHAWPTPSRSKWWSTALRNNLRCFGHPQLLHQL